jgi:hypothetical protein
MKFYFNNSVIFFLTASRYDRQVTRIYYKIVERKCVNDWCLLLNVRHQANKNFFWHCSHFYSYSSAPIPVSFFFSTNNASSKRHLNTMRWWCWWWRIRENCVSLRSLLLLLLFFKKKEEIWIKHTHIQKEQTTIATTECNMSVKTLIKKCNTH